MTIFKRVKRIENKVEEHDKQIQQMQDDLKETRLTLDGIDKMIREILHQVKQQHKIFIVLVVVIVVIFIFN